MLNNINTYLDKNLVIHIEGKMNFYNCMNVKNKLVNYTNSLNSIIIDLSNLKNEDSSIVVLIVGIMDISKKKTIKLVNISNSLRKLIKTYKLESILH